MLNSRFYFKPRYSGSRALVIGINTYENVSPLSYAVNDAQEFAEVLREKLDFPQENITCLLDENATRAKIEAAYFDLVTKAEVDDRIIFFFAGHGHTVSGLHGEKGFLIPHDAGSSISTYIPWNYLTQSAELIHAKHMLFIMDACYGGLALTRNIQSGSTRFVKDMLRRLSRQVLTAGKADEVVSDAGGPLPHHSVFTGHLLEGLSGKAATNDGIITASGLMAYVYGKVARDAQSNQTPHYGHFDGDGDMILCAPLLTDPETTDESAPSDILIEIPFAEEDGNIENSQEKIKKCKALLSTESTSIELHDFAMAELQRFLSATSEDHFKMDDGFSQEEFLERISKYETCCFDLSLMSACIAYWGKQSHLPLLQKIFSRATDRLSVSKGLETWIHLRWYPLIIQMYCSGIAAVDANRYDSLAAIFSAPMGEDELRKTDIFLTSVSNAISELFKIEIFKQIPGHENNLSPISEYLFRQLQPKLDDTLFIGKGYEKAFDEFEILFALSVADYWTEHNGHVWGPIGRFGWKEYRTGSLPVTRLLEAAKRDGPNWLPLKAGLFGGDSERFKSVSAEYYRKLQELLWL